MATNAGKAPGASRQLRRRSYSTPNIFVNNAAATAPVSAAVTPRGRVMVPVARARAKQSRDLLTLRKKPSSIQRHVTPASQQLIESALITTGDEFMAALHVDDQLQLNALEQKLYTFYTITQQFRKALESGVIQALIQENASDEHLIKLLANTCIIETCDTQEEFDAIQNVPVRYVRAAVRVTYGSESIHLNLETQDRDVHGTITGMYDLSTSAGKCIWRFGIEDNTLSSAQCEPIWDEKRAKKLQLQLDLPLTSSTGLFVKYLTAIIQMRIEQMVGKQSRDFSLPICGGHLVDILALLISGPSRKRKRSAKDAKPLTPLAAKAKKRKLA